MATKEELLEKLSTTKLETLARKGGLLEDAKSSALALWSYRGALIEYVRRSRKVTIADIEAILEPKKSVEETEKIEALVKESKKRTLTGAQKRELERTVGWKCELCGKKLTVKPDIHHITPKAEGGSDRNSNLLVLCPNCHRLVHTEKISKSELKRVIAARKKV
jgi:predicted HNH restriction endonuclease